MNTGRILILLLLMLMLVTIPAQIHSAPQEYERKLGAQIPRLMGTTIIKALDSGELEERGISSNSDSTKENIRVKSERNSPKSSESNIKKSLLSITGITEYEERGPITILNDTAFTLPANDFPGNGTYDDPYLISGYNITDSSGILIHIENTSKTFKIENCYLNGDGSYFQCIFLSNVTDGTIVNNIICNTGASDFTPAITLKVSHNNTFLNNIIFDCEGGMYLGNSLENTIINNTIRDNKNLAGFIEYGIFLDGSSKTIIMNNTIRDLTGRSGDPPVPAVGILHMNSDNNLICGNSIYNLLGDFASGIMAGVSCSNNNYTTNTIYNCTTYSIYLQDNSNNNIVFNNTLFDTSTAIALYDNSRFNNIYNNRIYNVAQSAISFTESHNNSVSSNVINDSNYALDLFDSYNNTFRYNLISNSSYGLYIYSLFGAEDNIIEWNNFINNTIHAYDSGSNNVYSHNYWDDHTSPDADTDGLVDTPYYIDQPLPDSLVDSYPRAYPYMNHAPVYIDDNTDFETLRFPGDGTQGNPYMINNFYFMDSSSTLIHIENTTAYFRISNNVFNGLGSNFNCIKLVNVTYGTIEYNIICDIQSGIYLQESSSNTLSTNTIHDISFSAIDLDNSHNNIIVSNNISDCAADAIWLIESDTNTITGNRINNCSYSFNEAIYLENSCDNNIISGNTISNCRDNGIYLYESCNNNTLSDNMIYSSSSYGIYLSSSHNNTLTNHTIYDCDIGIYLDSSRNNTLSGNTIHHCGTNIYLESSHNNTLSGNTVYDNVHETSITLESSSNNTVSGDTIYNCGASGLYLSSSSNYNTLSGNTIHDGYTGIYLSSSSNYNTLSSNTIHDCETGIRLSSSSNNTLTGNTIHDIVSSPFTGIHLLDSHNNTLAGNTIFNVTDTRGITLSTSHNNTLVSNTIFNITNGEGIFLSSSLDNIVFSNTIYNVTNGEGISLWSSHNNTLFDNTIHDCEDGGIYVWSSYFNNFTGNIIFDSPTSVGIALAVAHNNTLSGNSIYNCSYGTTLAQSSNNSISNNNIFNNSVYAFAISVGADPAENNTFQWNNFVNNGGASQAYDDGSENIVSYNYWNDWISPDTEPNGIVDDPYNLNGSANNNDTFPLTTPVLPTILIQSPKAQDYGSDSITVMLSGSPTIRQYSYYIHGIDSQNQTWTASVDRILPDGGPYTLHAYGSDITGNTVYDLVTFTIDAYLPMVVITSPDNTTYTHTNVPLIYTVLYGAATLYLDGMPNTTVVPNGSFVSDFPDVLTIPDGSYNITIISVDQAGNIAKDTVLFTIDTTPPTVDITSPANTTYSHTNVPLTYTVSDGLVTIYLNGMFNTTAVPSGSVVSDFPGAPAIPDGSYNITIISVDQAGNIAKDTVLFTIDTTPPPTTIPTTTTEETTPATSATSITTTSEAAPGSFPGVFTILLFLATLVVVIRRHKKT